MSGALAATIVSLIIADFIIKPIVIKRKLQIFNMKEFYREFFLNSTIAFILIALNAIIIKISVNSLIKWFGVSVIIFIINTIIAIAYFMLIGRIGWLKDVINKLRRKNENKHNNTSI